MQVSEGIGSEAYFLGVSVLAGIFLFFLYDILRILRRLIKHGTFLIGLEDILYWVFVTLTVFLMIYRNNDGMVRGFALGGVLLGMLLYYLLISRFVIKLNVLVFGTILKGIRRVLRVLFSPAKKAGKKIRNFSGKRLKKVWKAVKMGLHKL